MTEDNRIPEIRAVLDEADEKVPGVVPMSAWIYDPRAFFDRIQAILDSAPPAPRVFFPGDTVPAGTYLLNDGGGVLMPRDEPWEVIGLRRAYIELIVPSPQEWQATVDLARAAFQGDQ